MAHRKWCGEPCNECAESCQLDKELYCSPDCANLKLDGEVCAEACRAAGCDAFTAMLVDGVLNE